MDVQVCAALDSVQPGYLDTVQVVVVYKGTIGVCSLTRCELGCLGTTETEDVYD